MAPEGVVESFLETVGRRGVGEDEVFAQRSQDAEDAFDLGAGSSAALELVDELAGDAGTVRELALGQALLEPDSADELAEGLDASYT